MRTHNWGRAVAFWHLLGFTLMENFGSTSGRLGAPGLPYYLVIDEIAPDSTPSVDLYFDVGGGKFEPAPPLEVVQDFTPTHWGTEVMQVRDPDGTRHFLERRPG